jgi:tRNA 5-methylaminomethyl-2-thiouridine biosynthesis bifunctional protein
VLYGASHRPGDAAVDLRAEEAQANLQRLAEGRPQFAQRAAALPAEARRERAALRATLADHLPAAGAVSGGADGVYVLGGLGGRGFALAPLLAEHVAALIVGAPSPLPLALQALVSPDRRQARTGGNAAAQEPSQEPAVPSQPAPPVATPREP